MAVWLAAIKDTVPILQRHDKVLFICVVYIEVSDDLDSLVRYSQTHLRVEIVAIYVDAYSCCLISSCKLESSSL